MQSNIIDQLFLLKVLVVTAPVTVWASEVYVTNGSGYISEIDPSTNQIIANIFTIGPNPIGVATTPDGQYAYVANRASSTVSVIQTLNNRVVATVTTGSSPTFAAASSGFAQTFKRFPPRNSRAPF